MLGGPRKKTYLSNARLDVFHAVKLGMIEVGVAYNRHLGIKAQRKKINRLREAAHIKSRNIEILLETFEVSAASDVSNWSVSLGSKWVKLTLT